VASVRIPVQLQNFSQRQNFPIVFLAKRASHEAKKIELDAWLDADCSQEAGK
jgi:hypothetical protein